MKNVRTIEEASRYFELPKATLLYWEKEGLIHFERVPENNYRKVTADTIFQIENVLHLRNLGIPIARIKKVPFMPLNERYELYRTAVQEADRKIAELKSIKKSARKQLAQIEETKFLRKHPYRADRPDFQYLIAHSQDTVSAECFETGLFVILMEKPEQGNFREASIVETPGEQEILWERPEGAEWRSFLLVVKDEAGRHKISGLSGHLDALHAMGFRTGALTAQYLSEEMTEEGYFIYFKAYVEVCR